MNKSIGWLLGGMLILTGCSMPYSFDADGNFYSQVPLAEKYPATLQKKMQAGHHWNVLAQMEGDRILDALEGDKTSLYVEGTDAGSSAFRQGFEDLLTSYLVTKGKVVLVDKRLAKLNGAYIVKYKMQNLQLKKLATQLIGTKEKLGLVGLTQYQWQSKAAPQLLQHCQVQLKKTNSMVKKSLMLLNKLTIKEFYKS